MKEETKENRKQMLSAFFKAKDEQSGSKAKVKEMERRRLCLMYRV